MLLRLKGIKPVTVRYKGTTYSYYYHRATGEQIKAEPRTTEFAAEVARLDKKVADNAPRDGTLRALIVAYKKSPEFKENLAQRTKQDYDRVFDYLSKVDDLVVEEMDSSDIYALRDKAFKKHKRRFANYVVQVIRLLITWGKSRNYATKNVAEGVVLIPRPKAMKRANRPWSDPERDIILKRAPIQLRLMIALGMFGGLREGDACAALKTSYDGNLIEAIASKNGEPLWLPAHYRFREIAAEAFRCRQEAQARRVRRRKVVPLDPPTLAVTSHGTPWTPSGFRASFFKLLGKLEAENLVAPGLTFHGLRHTLGKLIIEGGGTKEHVKALIGDRSDAMAEWYSREFEKKGLATEIVRRLEQNERKRLEKTADADGKKKIGASRARK